MSKRTKERELIHQDIQRKRELAKTGMVASMGGVILTGMMKQKKAHTALSVAFLGFAYWHTTLYANNPNKKRRAEILASVEREDIDEAG